MWGFIAVFKDYINYPQTSGYDTNVSHVSSCIHSENCYFHFFFFGLLPSLPWRNPSLASTFAKSFGLQDALREFSWEENEFSQNCTFSALACTDLNKGQSSQYSDCLSFPLLWNLDLLLIYNCSNYNYLRFNSNNDNNDVEMASTQEKNPSFR